MAESESADNRSGHVSIFAVGDVFVDLDDGVPAFRHTTSLLKGGDIVVGNCEGVYSDDPAPSPTTRHSMTTGRSRASCLSAVPFHVMTCANNHIVDGGYRGLADTLEVLREQGIATTGAGMNAKAALRPAVVERDGIRVAFLACASIFPVGYEARDERPGLAAVRIRTHYSTPDPTFWEPGARPLITTSADPDDLRRLGQAIKDARASADLVVVACHWGASSQFETLQSYETEVARQIVELGADAVVCHHHHSLRGVEFWAGSPIFYGVGAFVHHFTHYNPTANQLAASRARYGEFAHGPRPGFPLYPFHPDARMTGIVTLDASKLGIVRAGFIPAEILADGSTEPYRFGDARAGRVFDYLRRMSDTLGAGVTFVEGERDGWAHLNIIQRSSQDAAIRCETQQAG